MNAVVSFSVSAAYLVGGGHLLAVDGERHQASGQIYQAANLQVHVTAAGGVSGAGCITAPNHVAVTPLHTVPVQNAVSQSVRQQPPSSRLACVQQILLSHGFLKNLFTVVTAKGNYHDIRNIFFKFYLS